MGMFDWLKKKPESVENNNILFDKNGIRSEAEKKR